MSNLWERFDDIVTIEEVEEAKVQNEVLYPGIYQMMLEEIKPDESNNGLPMIKGKFRMSNNRLVFYNQMLQNLNYPHLTAKNIAEAVTFISDLLDEDIVFSGLATLADIIESIQPGILVNMKVTYSKKDIEMKFPILQVVNVIGRDGFETGDETGEPVDNGDQSF